MTAAISVMKDLLLLLELVARAGRLLFVIAEEEPPACRARTPWPGRSSVTRGCGLQRQRATTCCTVVAPPWLSSRAAAQRLPAGTEPKTIVLARRL